ncbi:hypothetical protein BLNAU_23093 [Blattamonas nauphoetae]|uniref:Serine-threonine/tyrosine-protein kinase catalytic domain-containing protein n=1 Tax=Blattamonas nauphoetae TaxID=2049346 RepID=A0ABQ9WR71_9EUKA|nr:hypothetical protein BLNAU_23093 [Blattamonas nauphoetae]
MNLPALILVHLLCVEASHTIAFPPSPAISHISGNERALMPEMNLNHGTYHSKAYLMDSVSISLHGSDTTICHTSSVTKPKPTSEINQVDQPNGNRNTTPFIFMVSNSTLSMSHISLDCGWRGTSVGRISSSRLTIDNCPIISNPESSPFVMDNGCDDIGSSIFFVDCSHRSIDKSSLLALVSLTPSHTTHSRHTDTEQEVSSTLVSCSGLSLCDAHLMSGCGPLVGFSSSPEQDTGLWKKFETVLMGSRLVNMTSGELKGNGKGNGALEGCSECQKILDSCVTLSTNHLSGTACIDMNLGGSLLCSNTSFSHCKSSLEPSSEYPAFSLLHKKGAEPFQFGGTDTDDITFRRCTFLSMTSSDGAAISLFSSPTTLTVSESSFSKCTSTSDGTVYFSQPPSRKTPITISSSLFVKCSASRGGALFAYCSSTCTITESVFHDLSISNHAGGLYVSKTDILSLSTCSFDKCVGDPSSSTMGGGMPNVNDEIEASTLIPAVPDTTTSLVKIESTPTADQTSSTIQMIVSDIVDGKMLVLVDNTNNHEPPNVDSPPTIGRLLIFDFISSTESATQEVSFGEWGELQYESKYCVVGSWIQKTRLSFSSSIALTTPNPARIVQIICSLGSGTDHCWLELKGRTLPIGTYTVKLVGIDDFSFSVKFDGTTGTNTLNMFSSRHSERLFGTGSKLSFSTTYEVESITFEDDTEPFFLDPPRLFFTTPAEPPRLISVGPINFKDDSKRDIALIPLVGLNLPSGDYELKLLSSLSDSVSLPVICNSDSETIEVIVYSKDANQVKLKYGEMYTVEELITGTTKCLFETAFSIQVPVEPKRIEEGRVTLNGAKAEATLRLKGRVLTGGSYSLTLNSVSKELTSETSLSDDGELLFKVPISLLPTSILTFGATYTISLLQIGSDDVFVNSDVELAVPDAPIATATSCDLDAESNMKFAVTLSGSNLPTSGSFVVSFIDLAQTITVTMSSSGGLSSLVEVSKATEIKFAHTYTISSIVKKVDGSEDEHILCSGVTMTTPDGPSLLGVSSATLQEDDVNRVVLSVSFENMAEGSFMMKVKNSATSTEYTLSSQMITTLGSESGSMAEVVYESGKLEYGESYTIVSLESSTLAILIKDTAGFTVPPAPARVEGATPALTSLRTSVIVELRGQELKSGAYSVTLSSHPSNSVSGILAGGFIRFEVSTVSTDPIHLGFGDTITVEKVMHGLDDVFVNSDVTFTVPNPPIVKTAHVHPNSINTTMTLDLTGKDLKLDGFYTVTLSPPFSFDMLFNSSETVSSAELLLGRADCLQHNTKYTIVSIARVRDDSDVILTDGTVSFTTPKLPVPLILHVNGKEGEDDVLCGAIESPCAMIDFTWSIVSALQAPSATVVIVNSSQQSQPIVVSSGMSILLSNGGNVEPTLTLHSSASMGDNAGMVVVSDATFSIVDVTVKIESTDPSFVFLSASESTIILKEGSFVGESLSTLSLNSESEELCSWESGIVRVDNCITTLNRMTFSSLLQGAIHLTKGALTIESSSLHNNSPNLSSYPSARRNIRCVDGNVTIGSLNGGDGSKDHPSAWISTTDCTVSGDDARPNSALFVPTLSSESNSSWILKEKRFSVLIVGTTLIPCDLYLEVFEMKKDKSEGESKRVELSFETTDSFNETHINISIALTSLSSLKDALEWRGRLVFGLNETSSESFVVQKSSSDRLAESTLINMKWWLPLVIVLLCCALILVIVVVLVLRRRQMRKAQKQPNDPEEMHDDEKLEFQDNSFTPNEIQSSAGFLKGKSLTQNCGDDMTQSMVSSHFLDGSHVDEQFVEVMDVESGQTKEVVKMETLFERLHKHKTEIVGKRQRQIEIARGLQKIGKTNGNSDILQKLTSHWILIGADGHFNLQLKEDGAAHTEHRSQTQSQTAASSVAVDAGSVNVNNKNASGMERSSILTKKKEIQEGQRWQAPEQGENDAIPSCDVEKVTVFRFGLVLWEMETGQIPFRETDGVNAGRQLKAGVKPQMSLVENKEMEELILKCLELKATDRIGLDDVISSLSSIPDDPVPTQQLFGS